MIRKLSAALLHQVSINFVTGGWFQIEARFSGPYEVERKISETDYVVKTPDRRKKSHVCHVNMIKRYVVRAQTIMPSKGVVQRASPVLSVASPSYSGGVERATCYCT